jgi:hypothetical protein
VPETSFPLSNFVYANTLCVTESVPLRLLGLGFGLSSVRDSQHQVLLILIEVVGMDVVVATKMIMELEQRFPSNQIMDAFCIVYPQFWLGEVNEAELQRHLGAEGCVRPAERDLDIPREVGVDAGAAVSRRS